MAEPAPPAPPAKTSRAGRNLPAAIAVGVTLGAGLIAILLWAPRVWVAVVAVAMAVATHEVVSRLRATGATYVARLGGHEFAHARQQGPAALALRKTVVFSHGDHHRP